MSRNSILLSFGIVFFAWQTSLAQDYSAMWNQVQRWNHGVDPMPNNFPLAAPAGGAATMNPLSPPNTADVQVFNPSNFWQSENSIGVNFSNPNQVMVSTNGQIPLTPTVVQQTWAFSTDGGATWPASMQSENIPPPIINCLGDPVAFFDRSGRAYYSTIGASGTSSAGMFFVSTTDFGATWSARSNADNTSSTGDDKQHSAADYSGTFPNNVYCAWTDFNLSGSPLIFSRSTDQGQTWGSRQTLQIGSLRGQGVHLAIGPNGEVYAIWAHYASTGTAEIGIGMAKSTDGGATFNTPAIAYPIAGTRTSNGAITALNGTRTSSFPYADVDRSNGPRRGWVYVVAGELVSGQADVFLHRSSDGGITWSTGIQVNGPDVQTGKWQFQSSIAVDPTTGGISVSYYSMDSTGTNFMANRYMAYSVDGGDTWDRWVISDVRALWGVQGTPNTNATYNGDYSETAATGGKAWAIWQDRRSGSTGASNRAYVERVIYGENFGWISGTVTNVNGGGALQNVSIDFVENELQQGAISAANGSYFAGALVDTPATTANYTLRAKKFGFLDTLIAVTLTRDDTLTRNFAMRPLDLVLTKTSIAFPPTPAPGTSRDSLVARNQGTTTLNLSSLTSTNPRFTVTPGSGNIVGGDSLKIYVTYTPVLGGTDTGRVIVLSNSIFKPRVDVLLNGTAIGVPHFTASVDSVTKTLEGGARDSVLFRMRNTGTTAGDFSARAIVYPRTNPTGTAKVIPMTLEEVMKSGSDNSASAIDYVIPPNYANTPGGATFNGQLANAARTYQFLIHDSLLTGLIGQRITAVRWRIPASASAPWPAAEVTYSNYDIYLSGSVAPANRSLTFAQNVVGAQTQVRTGSLVIPAGSYPSGGSPNAFGPEITFDTPWQYTGGHLLVELRHNGFTGTSSSIDAISTTGPGYGTAFSACWTGSYTGTAGSQGNFGILSVTPGGGNWFSVTPTTGTVALGDSIQMSAQFDATDPDVYNNPGNYFGRIEVIATNSTLADTLRVPARMFLIPPAGARLSLDIDSLNFGDVEIDSNKTLSVLVRNIGSANLNVTGTTISNPNFSALPASFTLASLDTQRVNVKFTAPSPGATHSGTMQFVSNDPLAPSVGLQGHSVGIAHIVVSPDSFIIPVAQGDSASRSVVIRNTGLGELTYTSSVNGGFIGLDSTEVGNSANVLATTSGLMRGGVVQVTTSIQLSEIKSWLNITASREMRWIVYENTTGTSFTKIFEATTTSGTGGPQWFASGPVNITLEAGKRYAIGVNWAALSGISYYWQASAPVPVPISFGTITGGLAGTVFPPPATITQGALSSLYYTQLVTSSSQWLKTISGTSGTIASGDSATLGFRVYTSQLPLGTARASVVVQSNDLLAPMVEVPVVLDIVTDVASSVLLPDRYELFQNYPNPFNPSTTIRFSLPEQSIVSLKIYNLLGQEIETLAQGEMPAAFHKVVWNGKNSHGAQVATGMYFYRFEAKGSSGQTFNNLKKLILLK